jgi:DNA-binding MarR family transcriptional regulator
LSADERGAWLGLVQSYATLVRKLDDELRSVHDLRLNSFEVLAQLYLASGHRLRMMELADHLVFTRSGVTRLVDRLEREGFVRRLDADRDGRGVLAELTEAGWVAFRTAAATHVDGLRRLFFDKLAVGELEGLNAVWDRVGPDAACAREQRLRSTRDDWRREPDGHGRDGAPRATSVSRNSPAAGTGRPRGGVLNSPL